MRKRAVTLITMCIAICMFFSACAKKTSDMNVSDTQLLLDTVVTITIYPETGKNPMSFDEARDVLKTAFDEIKRLEDLFSITIEGSDIDEINKNAGIDYIEVSAETAEVLSEAVRFSGISDGKFDITAGPLLSLWNISGGGYLPTENEIFEAIKFIDHNKILIDGNAVMLADVGMSINLGSIAKGYIADKIKALLIDNGVDRAIVSLGGNVIALDETGGTPFNVGIQSPTGDTGELFAIVKTSNGSVVTSGNYERFFIENGVRYHHIMDPDIGYPAEAGLISVTVLSDISADGDALSTAVFVYGAEEGLKLIESIDGAECILVTDSGEVLTSSGINSSNVEFLKS